MKMVPVALVLAYLIWPDVALACEPPDWVELSKAYGAFLDEPSDMNAKRVLAMLPFCSPDIAADNAYWTELAPDAGLPGHNYQYYHEVLGLARQGNVNAIEIMFRLAWLYDGEEGEALSTDLGGISDSQPKAFLKAYSAERGEVRDLDTVLTGLGPEYIDDFPAQIKKLKKRYAILSGVREVPKSSKEDCLKVLTKQIDFLKETLRDAASQS